MAVPLDDGARRVVEALEAEQRERSARAERGEDVLPLRCLPREGAELLHLLAATGGRRRALEVGTSAGYSGVWIAAALPADGELVTIERKPRKIELARRTFARAGLDGRVRIEQGEALQVLSDLQGPFDLAFLDADKDAYPAYLRHCARLLRAGGLLVADNVLSHRRDLAPYVRDVRAHEEFVTVTVPVGNGLEVSLKR